ncbi:hypothetical protein LTR86_008170 [Recurvomyces mirabilis]|nr:hypothetical protein LTR86_008170 [Recurvomyces mirabilis]
MEPLQLANRLHEIARKSGATRYQVPPALSLPRLPPATLDSAAASKATCELLARLRTSQAGYKYPDEKITRLFKTKSKKENQRDITKRKYEPSELHAALDHAIRTSQPLPVIEDLLNRHAIFNVDLHLPIAIERDDLGLTTSILGDPKTSNHPQLQRSLDIVLHRISYDLRSSHEVSPRQLDILKALLAAGARAESCVIGGVNALANLVEQDNLGLVCIILQSRNGASNAVLSAALLDAARSASVPVTAALLAYGADPAFGDAAALRASIQKCKYDTAVTLLAHNQHVVPVRMVSASLELMLDTVPSESDYLWLELLLTAGADHSTRKMTRRLAHAVRTADGRTIKLLVDFKVSVSQCDFEPLRAAIARRSLQTLALLLSGGTCTREAAVLIPRLKDHLTDHSEELSATPLLVDEEVLSLVRYSKPHLDVLMNAGASFGDDRGRALKVAVSAANVHLVKTACSQRLGSVIVSDALLFCYSDAAARGIADKAAVMGPLLDSGVTTTALDHTLGHMIAYKDCSKVLCSLPVSNNAKITDSEQLINTIDEVDDDVYGLLVSTVPTESSLLDSTLPQTLHALTKARIVLLQGCRQGARDVALLSEMRKSNPRADVVRLLLEFGASVNQSAGDPLTLAAGRPGEAIMSLLLSADPSKDTLGAALSAVTTTEHAAQETYCKMLLPRDIAQRHLDVALLNLARSHGQERRVITLIELLQTYGARAGHDNGEALRRQVTSGSTDILKLLLTKPLPHNVLSLTFETARELEDDTIKLSVFPLLLEAAVERLPGIHRALVDAVRTSPTTMDLVSILLAHGASVAWNNAEAMCETIRNHDTTTLVRLLEPPPSRATLDACLSAAMKEQGSARLGLVQMLLNVGASSTQASDVMLASAINGHDHDLLKLSLSHQVPLGPRSASAASDAASHGNIEILKILVPTQKEHCTTLLDALRNSTDVFRSTVGTECARIIMSGTTSQRSCDEALLTAVVACREGCSCRDLVSLLLRHAANVNGCQGTMLSIAAQHRPTSLFKELLAVRPSSGTVTKAIPGLIQAGNAEDDLLGALTSCFNLGTEGPDIDKDGAAEGSIVAMTVRLYPGSHALLKTMLDYGYRPPTDLKLSLGPDMPVEGVPFLLWTVWRARDASRDVLMELVNRTILLKDGHGASYSSLDHGERTPLFELVLHCRPSTTHDRRAVCEIAKALLQAGAPAMIAYQNKSVVFSALHNEFPIEVLAALLKTTIATQLNLKHNIYTSDDGLCFSPTMYLRHGPLRGSQHRDRLITLLKNKDCHDVYYRVSGDQPEHDVGMPNHIEEMHREQQVETQRHASIRREATLRRNIEDEDRRRQKDIETERFASIGRESTLRRILEEEARISDLRGLQDRHRLISNQEHERSAQQQAVEDSSRQKTLEHTKSLVKVSQAGLDNQNRAGLAHATSLAQIRQAEKEHSAGLDRQIEYDREQTSNRQYERKKQLIDFENESFQTRAKTMATYAQQIQAAQQYIGSSNLLRIGGRSVHDIPD